MAPSSTETRVGFESWCKDRYYFLKTKKTTEYFPSQTFISGTAGRNIGKFFRPGYRKFWILVIFVKTVKIMKTSSLMMCALVALTACGTGVKQSVRTPVEMGERIELKTPDPKMGLTINEALAARSSSRDFSPEMLSLEELSGVLWAAAGVNREDGHLTAPSAMALYPIRVYAFLPEGVYRYDSKANVLNRVVEGDRRELTAMQDFAYTAPLNLVYVADYTVYADRNQPVDRIRFWCAADAGGYTENVNLYAAGNGLKAITRGSFKEEALLELLGLDPAQYGVILAQTVGR
ncbi:MAG: SagB/ThcOx family dehydrogenase [Alistipes putredinis]|nr:SagB/ThcOx family dehydrogenase [Alistipes putredinis]